MARVCTDSLATLGKQLKLSETQLPHVWSSDYNNSVVVKIKLYRLFENKIHFI